MIEILKTLGLPTLTVVGIVVAAYLLKEIFGMIKATRLKAQQDVLATILAELDAQLSEFYMPLSARFRVSKLLFETTTGWQVEGKYSNDRLSIESDDPEALRNLVVRRVFLPLNREVERLLLEKGHLATPEDATSYAKILEHFILWRSLEEAVCENAIRDYEATALLQFPTEEVSKCLGQCDLLLAKRNRIRDDLLTMRVLLDPKLPGKQKQKEVMK
jgi:hypothetical protein